MEALAQLWDGLQGRGGVYIRIFKKTKKVTEELVKVAISEIRTPKVFKLIDNNLFIISKHVLS